MSLRLLMRIESRLGMLYLGDRIQRLTKHGPVFQVSKFKRPTSSSPTSITFLISSNFLFNHFLSNCNLSPHCSQLFWLWSLGYKRQRSYSSAFDKQGRLREGLIAFSCLVTSRLVTCCLVLNLAASVPRQRIINLISTCFKSTCLFRTPPSLRLVPSFATVRLWSYRDSIYRLILDAPQSEGEGPDGSDKPPLDGLTTRHISLHPNTFVNGTTNHMHLPLLPSNIVKGSISGAPLFATPCASPSPSDSGSCSAPPTRPPSQAPSRAPSVSGGTSGNKLAVPPIPKTTQKGKPLPSEKVPPTPTTRSRAPSNAHSDSGQKFTLKDLITASAPKLSRKSSARSTSSKKSDSDAERKSVAGDSAISLTQKYGVCQKVAIGKGATAVVRLAHKWDRSEEKLYAVKEFRKRRKNESEKEYVKKLTAEFCISSTLHHVNIVETVDLVQDENQHWCEVMEFCPGGDLYAAIKKGGMSPSEVECCFKQMLSGVSYLHSQGVAHRDIKPENLFFDTKGHLKIGDYGASTVYRLPWEATIHMSTGLCGSEPYIAPEQFLGKPYDARLVDIWACGIVYYCLHFQEMPWRAAQMSDTMYAVYVAACEVQHKDKDKDKDKEVALPPTINNLSPRGCRSLIRKMLEPDPKLRSPIEDIVAHSWVQGIEVCHAVGKPTHIHVHAMQQAQILYS